jgi:hypothetical protein
MIDRLTATCLIGSLCFAAALPLELRSNVTKPIVASSPIAKTDESPTTRRVAPATKQRVATVLARPLFSATRRPPENEQDGHPDTSLNDLRLTGILIMPDQHFAIFVGSNGKPVMRSEGEMVSDWRIENIAAQSIFLTGPAGTTTLEPKADPNLTRLQSAAQMAASHAPPAAKAPPPPASNVPVRPAPALRSGR